MEFEKIKEEIKQILSPKRYNHSLGVAKRAEELAIRYHQDVEKAKLVGIAHDIAKEIPTKQAYEYAKLHKIELDEIEQNEPSLLHSKIGAHICKEKYHFSKDMVDAIIYHTTGNVKMDDFAKILFLADKTEEGRTIPLQEANKIIEQDLNEGMLYLLRTAMQYTLNKERLIHPDSIHLMNKLIMEKGKLV